MPLDEACRSHQPCSLHAWHVLGRQSQPERPYDDHSPGGLRHTGTPQATSSLFSRKALSITKSASHFPLSWRNPCALSVSASPVRLMKDQSGGR